MARPRASTAVAVALVASAREGASYSAPSAGRGVGGPARKLVGRGGPAPLISVMVYSSVGCRRRPADVIDQPAISDRIIESQKRHGAANLAVRRPIAKALTVPPHEPNHAVGEIDAVDLRQRRQQRQAGQWHSGSGSAQHQAAAVDTVTHDAITPFVRFLPPRPERCDAQPAR